MRSMVSKNALNVRTDLPCQAFVRIFSVMLAGSGNSFGHSAPDSRQKAHAEFTTLLCFLPASCAACQPISSRVAQHSGQLLMFQGKIGQGFRAFTNRRTFTLFTTLKMKGPTPAFTVAQASVGLEILLPHLVHELLLA